MPTSVDIKNLKINKLTEAQYDTAVQGGVIGENELSVITDMVDKAVQVSTLPTASADELGNIYQYIGTTDANYTNGYFYKCEGAGDPVVYSWVRVDVQPGSSLPSQSGNAGKFLTTDGTAASWADALTNGAILPQYSIRVGSSTGSLQGTGQVYLGKDIAGNNGTNSTIIGCQAKDSSSQGTVVIGYGAASGSLSNYGIAIGNDAKTGTNARSSIAIGRLTATGAQNAIQLGGAGGGSTTTYTNSDANTFKVGNANGNFEMMDANGYIPAGRLKNAATAPSTMPTLAVADWSSNTQTVTVSGVTASNIVIVAPAPASAADYAAAGIVCTAQGTDSLTFTCTTVPSNAITVNVIIMG